MPRMNPGNPDLAHDTMPPSPEGANNNERFDPTVGNERGGFKEKVMRTVSAPTRLALKAGQKTAEMAKTAGTALGNVAMAPITVPLAIAKKGAEVTGNAVSATATAAKNGVVGAAVAAKNGVVGAAEMSTLKIVRGVANSARGGVETQKTVMWRVPGEGQKEVSQDQARQYAKDDWGEEVRNAA
jgi:hypothetical protein